VNDVVKTAAKIVNSPEAKIVGSLAGDGVSEKLKQTANVVNEIAKQPLLVGDKNA
jgi:hypothetical protein